MKHLEGRQLTSTLFVEALFSYQEGDIENATDLVQCANLYWQLYTLQDTSMKADDIVQ